MKIVYFLLVMISLNIFAQSKNTKSVGEKTPVPEKNLFDQVNDIIRLLEKHPEPLLEGQSVALADECDHVQGQHHGYAVLDKKGIVRCITADQALAYGFPVDEEHQAVNSSDRKRGFKIQADPKIIRNSSKQSVNKQ